MCYSMKNAAYLKSAATEMQHIEKRCTNYKLCIPCALQHENTAKFKRAGRQVESREM